MKILHVYKTYYPDTYGGVEQVIRQISMNAQAFDVKNRVFTLSRNPNPPIIYDQNVEVVRAPLSFELASTSFSLSALRQFRQCTQQADIVHYHFPWPFGDVLHFLSLTQKPTVVTYHSDIVKQKNLLHLYTPLMNRFLSAATAIVTTSPNYLATSKTLQKFRDKTTVIPIGLNPAHYPAPSTEKLNYWREKVGENFFLFIGVLRYYKGLSILLDACKNQSHPVVIMGTGPLEHELKTQAKTLGLTNVTFVGALSDEDKIALLTLCFAIVFPSHVRSEAFGISLLEGAMHGKPLISAEIGTGSSYININGETGLVVKANDSDAFAKAMQYLLDHSTQAGMMGKQAKARFDTLFTADKMVEHYVELYKKVLNTSL